MHLHISISIIGGLSMCWRRCTLSNKTLSFSFGCTLSFKKKKKTEKGTVETKEMNHHRQFIIGDGGWW
jgi:hypothetical protein